MTDEFVLVDYRKAIRDLDDDASLYKDLLDCWFSEIQLDKAVLEKLCQKEDLSEAAAYVHRVKGAAGSLGAHALFETAQKTENLLRGKTQGNVQEYIEELLSVYDSTEKEFTLIRTRF